MDSGKDSVETVVELVEGNGEIIRNIYKDVADVLIGLRSIQQGVDDLVGVPSKLEGIDKTTAAIMADLVISRKEHTDATSRLTDALIKLANRVAVGLFMIVLLCLAGFFGRNLVVGYGATNAAFSQSTQGVPGK